MHLRKQEKSQLNKLNCHVRELEKEQTKLKANERKETVKIRDEEKKKQIREPLHPEKINEIRSSFSFLNIKLLSLYTSSLRKDRGPK